MWCAARSVSCSKPPDEYFRGTIYQIVARVSSDWMWVVGKRGRVHILQISHFSTAGSKILVCSCWRYCPDALRFHPGNEAGARLGTTCIVARIGGPWIARFVTTIANS